MGMKIPLYRISWDNNDVDKVSEVIKRGAEWTLGNEVKIFEEKIANYIEVPHAFAVNSGTSALHAILAAHDIGHGDEVIVPSFTFIATANAVLFVNANPVFAEIEEETYGLNPDDVKKKISPKTKAILPIHYGGSPCKIGELIKIAQTNNLILIEDAAEALGASVNGMKVGGFGDSSAISFCGPKIITTGEGGIVLTKSKEIYEKVKLICNHGRVDENYFNSSEQTNYVRMGYNFRMSTMTAALGIAQMEKIDKLIRLRRENAAYLFNKLSNIKEIEIQREPNGYFHAYQMYTIRVELSASRRFFLPVILFYSI